jgi:hypothetical protein
MARRYLWQTETTRPGVNMEQIAVLRQLTPDLKPMKRIREEFEKRRPEIFLRWERERKEEEEPQEPPTKEKETIVPPGPLPPKEQPKKQAEKEDKGKKEKPK